MSDELKPCPFCGGNASISKDHDPDGSGAFYAVKCHKCRAKSSEIYAVETCNIHFTQVRDAWNRRADLADALAAALRDLRGAVCGETGFAQCVRDDSGTAYPWPALDAAEEAATAALAAWEGRK